MESPTAMAKWCTKMVITTEDNGSMGRSKGEVYRSTTKKATDMKDNGKVISQMVKAKSLTGMDPLMSESSKITSDMERENFMIFRTRMLLINFIKMAF